MSLNSWLDSPALLVLTPGGTSPAPTPPTEAPVTREQHPLCLLPTIFHCISDQWSHRPHLNLEEEQPLALWATAALIGVKMGRWQCKDTSNNRKKEQYGSNRNQWCWDSKTRTSNANEAEENELKNNFMKKI